MKREYMDMTKNVKNKGIRYDQILSSVNMPLLIKRHNIYYIISSHDS